MGANASLLEILDSSRAEQYKPGERLLTEGSSAQSVYYVESGSVEVSYVVKGTKILVALIGAGEFFGEVGFFDGATRVRNIKANETSLIRIWDREQVDELREKNPLCYATLTTVLARSVCGKFRRLLEEREPLIAYAASLSTGQRSFHESRPVPDNLFQWPAWRFVNRTVESFKAELFNLSYALQEAPRDSITQEHAAECYKLLDRFNSALQECLHLMDDPKLEVYTWGFIFKEIFPYFMRSRFAERAYYKPKGYAGDFQMMEMIYRNEPDGDGKLGILVDSWCLNTKAASAVRCRRDLMSDLLEHWSRERREGGKPLRIMNLACGSNRELFDFLGKNKDTQQMEITCVDADPEALEYTNRQINVIPHNASIRFMRENVVKWALGRTRHHFGQLDIIYSAGLMDYLDRRMFQKLAERCYDHLNPGGVLILGNFGESSPNRAFMDHILKWNLIYRSEEELTNILAGTSFGNRVRVVKELNGINLFALATRPEEES